MTQRLDASFCGPTVTAAMGFVAHTDALIFDIRQNGGGQPAMVTLIASYLFPKLGIHIGTGLISEIIYSAIGAILLLLIVRLVRTGGRF